MEDISLCNMKAEQDVLASILVNNDILCDIIDMLEANDFFSPGHCLLYSAMKDLYEKGIIIDLTTLREYFGNDLDKFGGYNYIVDLISSGLPRFNIEYAKIVKEKSKTRKLYNFLQDAIKNLEYNKKSSKDILEELQIQLLSFNTVQDGYYINDKELMKITLSNIENNYKSGGGILGIPTGINYLDAAINGLNPEKLYVIGGRPGMGKSALALNICQNISKSKRVAYYSLEMNEQELGIKRLSMLTALDSTKIERGLLEDDEWMKLLHNLNDISSGNCITNCKPGIHINNIYAHSKKMKLQGGLDLIIIDHIGYMNKKGMGDNLREQTSNLALAFKNISKEFKIPVIILSQLSRKVEEKDNKRPNLSDLKESSGIEENADVILLLYRDEYYNKNTEEKNIIECNIAKQRSGRTGVIRLAWIPEFQKITDLYG